MPTLEEAPFIDWFDPAVVANPEPLLAEMRGRTAVARMPLGATVIRREEVRQLLSDPRLISSNPALVRIQGVNEGPLYDMVTASVIAIDGSDHTRLRRLVSRSFTPSASHEPARTASNGAVDSPTSPASASTASSTSRKYW